MIKNSKEPTQEDLYNWLLKRNTATNREITDQFNDAKDAKYIYIKYINPLLKQGKLDRIRRGLYTAIDPVTGNPVADPVIVASKIREDYYLGYYTALVIYGTAYSAMIQNHICLKPENRFREFSYNGIQYTPVYTRDTETNIQTRNHRGHQIRVCGKERLLIELVDSPGNVGGWEQALKSLESLGGIDYEKIPSLLTKLGNQRLIRKTGYILEKLRQHSVYHRDLPEEALETLTDMVHGQPYYLEKDTPGPLNKRWLMYIQPRFDEYLRGI
jgi:predicted transcriptional regulator of viral defense system